MATNYKILGQVQASSAAAKQNLNLWPDPNFEYYSGNHSSATGSSSNGPAFVWWQGDQRNNSHPAQHYQDSGNGVFANLDTAGRSSNLRFSQHHEYVQPHWRSREEIAPFLDASKVYTLSFWHRLDVNAHGGHTIAYSRDNSANWTTVRDGQSYGNHTGTANGNYTDANTGTQQPYSTWVQHYTTFQGTNNYFRMYVRLYSYHSHNEWQYLHLDNIYLTEGALPKSQLPIKAPDGASGNANALYTAPFTTRSEGWEGTPFASATVRKLTGSWQTAYLVPDTYQTVVSTISISNIDATNSMYRVAVQKYGETLSHKHLLCFDQPISANSNETLTLGLTLSAGDKIMVQSDTDRVQFQVYGSEITP
jgi:hypothetical protein